MDTHLEVVDIPVSDVDPAKTFCSMPTRLSRPSVFTPSRAMQAGLDDLAQQDPEAHSSRWPTLA
jgi:hypothetical protein